MRILGVRVMIAWEGEGEGPTDLLEAIEETLAAKKLILTHAETQEKKWWAECNGHNVSAIQLAPLHKLVDWYAQSQDQR